MKNSLSRITAFFRNTGEKIQDTHPAIQIVSFIACALIILILVISMLFLPDSKRFVFFFPENTTGKVRTEIRYLPKARTVEERLGLYIDELVLGPINSFYTPLYPKNVRIESCFIRKSAVYINLSRKALEIELGGISSFSAFNLFKKNVFTNFKNLDKIHMYIDGIEVYSGNAYDDVEQKIKKR